MDFMGFTDFYGFLWDFMDFMYEENEAGRLSDSPMAKLCGSIKKHTKKKREMFTFINFKTLSALQRWTEGN